MATATQPVLETWEDFASALKSLVSAAGYNKKQLPKVLGRGFLRHGFVGAILEAREPCPEELLIRLYKRAAEEEHRRLGDVDHLYLLVRLWTEASGSDPSLVLEAEMTAAGTPWERAVGNGQAEEAPAGQDRPGHTTPRKLIRARNIAAIALLGTLGVVALVIGSVHWFGSSSSEPPEASDATANQAPPLRAQDAGRSCQIEAGDPEPSEPANVNRFRRAFSIAYRKAGGAPSLGCPKNGSHRWDQGIIQNLERNGGEIGAIMALSPEHAVVLTGPAWFDYERIGGGGGSAAPLIGYPSGASRPMHGGAVVPLSGGGAMVGASAGGPFYWVPAPVLERWVANGGGDGNLGFPRSSPPPAAAIYRQQFDCGSILIDVDRRAVVERSGHC